MLLSVDGHSNDSPGTVTKPEFIHRKLNHIQPAVVHYVKTERFNNNLRFYVNFYLLAHLDSLALIINISTNGCFFKRVLKGNSRSRFTENGHFILTQNKIAFTYYAYYG